MVSVNKSVAVLSVLLAAMLGGCADAGPVRTDLPGVANLSRDGDIFISGSPAPESLDALKARGVNCVIDLRRPEETSAADVEAAEARGMAYFHLPMPSDQLTDDQAERFLKVMNEHKDEPILIHCASGNRAAAMYGLYLAEQGGCSASEALRRARQAGLRNEKLANDLQETIQGNVEHR